MKTFLAIIVLAALAVGGLWLIKVKDQAIYQSAPAPIATPTPVTPPPADPMADWRDVHVDLGPGASYDITLRELGVPAGETYQSVLIEDVVFDGSGAHPDSFDQFQLRHVGGHDYYFIKTGLFEGVLGLNYYLVTDNKIYAFTLVSHGVNWTNPAFDLEQDPGHQKLKEILTNL